MTDYRGPYSFYTLFGQYAHKLQYNKVWPLVTYLVKRLLLPV
jgi:hypothetical protein